MNLCQRCKKDCKHNLAKCTYYSPTKMTNFEHIKQMSVEELALLFMKVNCAYDIPCMLGISDCKYPHINNNCAICFKEWLESEVNDNDH